MAALAQDLTYEILPVGSTTTASCDEALARVVAQAAADIPYVTLVDEVLAAGGIATLALTAFRLGHNPPQRQG